MHTRDPTTSFPLVMATTHFILSHVQSKSCGRYAIDLLLEHVVLICRLLARWTLSPGQKCAITKNSGRKLGLFLETAWWMAFTRPFSLPKVYTVVVVKPLNYPLAQRLQSSYPQPMAVREKIS